MNWWKIMNKLLLNSKITTIKLLEITSSWSNKIEIRLRKLMKNPKKIKRKYLNWEMQIINWKILLKEIHLKEINWNHYFDNLRNIRWVEKTTRVNWVQLKKEFIEWEKNFINSVKSIKKWFLIVKIWKINLKSWQTK